MNPFTTVIVLNYNGAEINNKFLQCLYKHTENFDLILIDNGSSDGSAEHLRKFSEEHSNVTFIGNKKNLGVINGRNQGYDEFIKLDSKNEYLVFLDNDQFCQTKWLESHHEAMAEGKYDVIGVEAWLMNQSFWPIKNCRRPQEGFTYVGCGGMLMKTIVPKTIGMFDSQFNPCYFEDPDFVMRARQAGFKIGWNYKAKVVHLPHQTLGKNPNRLKLLQQSHLKFKKKWGSTFMRTLYQPNLQSLK